MTGCLCEEQSGQLSVNAYQKLPICYHTKNKIDRALLIFVHLLPLEELALQDHFYLTDSYAVNLEKAAASGEERSHFF